MGQALVLRWLPTIHRRCGPDSQPGATSRSSHGQISNRRSMIKVSGLEKRVSLVWSSAPYLGSSLLSEAPNGAICNVLCFVCLALCYAALFMVILPVADSSRISRIIATCLGVAILIQCCLVTWSLCISKISSWSSNPRDTLAGVEAEGLANQKGRCMMPARDRRLCASPRVPLVSQDSAYHTNKDIFWVLSGVSFTLGAGIIWTAITITHCKRGNTLPLHWTFLYFGGPCVDFQYRGSLLFLNIALQSLLTIGIYCAELQVSLSRDEAIWRTLLSPKGSDDSFSYSSVNQPLGSWQWSDFCCSSQPYTGSMVLSSRSMGLETWSCIHRRSHI